MGKVFKKVFKSVVGGGTSSASRKSQEAQLAENRRTQEFIERMSGRARSDVLGLAPAALNQTTLGSQRAIDVLTGALPQQLGTFQQGNVGAQRTLLAGLPQYQNAILGLPTDLSVLRPQRINYDLGAFEAAQVPTVDASLFSGLGASYNAPSLGNIFSGNLQGGNPFMNMRRR